MSNNPTTSKTVCRGDIFYVIGDDNKQVVGSEMWPDRPALVVSNDVFNKTSGVVQIVYLSGSDRKKPCPTHIKIQSGNRSATALCEQIHTVDKTRLKDLIGHATDDEMRDIEGAMLFTLQINSGKNPQGIFRKFERQLDAYLKDDKPES